MPSCQTAGAKANTRESESQNAKLRIARLDRRPVKILVEDKPMKTITPLGITKEDRLFLEARAKMRDAAFVEADRFCSWHKTRHPVEEFNPNQRWCKTAHRESQARRRAEKKERRR